MHSSRQSSLKLCLVENKILQSPICSKHGRPVITWIQAILKNRLVTTALGDDSAKAKTRRCCPQRGALSPLLWSAVVDKVLELLTQDGFEVQGYADDLETTVRRRHDFTMSERVQTALTFLLI